MSKNRKKSEDSLKSKGSKTPPPQETYLPELDTDLQRPYDANRLPQSEKPSGKSKKRQPVVQLRNLTPSEFRGAGLAISSRPGGDSSTTKERAVAQIHFLTISTVPDSFWPAERFP
jgi:hypothetical protein